MTSFWPELPRPFFALAPLADVTDPALRKIIAKYGKPDVMYTEFVSADGLYYTREVKKIPDAENPLMRDLQFDASERPIVMQVFSNKREMIVYAAKLAEQLGFDGFDINMGCPDSSVEKQGAGAAMIKTPELARELIQAAKDATSLPVSIKTRIGYNTEILETWLPSLLAAKPASITLHLRTRKEMSSVPAHWELMNKAVELRNKLAPEVLLIGNGDLKDLEDAKAKVAASGCDGAMLGRAVFGNPWLFNPEEAPKDEQALHRAKLQALVELAQEFEKLSPPKSFAILKKHIKAFVTGYDGAADLRAKLMEAQNAKELAACIL